MILLGLDDAAGAADVLEEALDRAGEARDGEDGCLMLMDLAQAELALGRSPSSIRGHLERSLELARSLGLPSETAYVLVVTAALAVREGQHVLAATLVGSADALLESLGAELESLERKLRYETLAAAERALGPRSVTDGLAAGRSLGPERAADLALARL